MVSILSGIGLMLLMLGISCADSNFLVTVIFTMVGLAMMLYASRKDESGSTI